MRINLIPAYEHLHRAFPYTHRAEAEIRSLGTFYGGLHLPDLWLMVDYHFDQKTKQLVHDVKLTFRPIGPCEPQLNFPHAEVVDSYFDDRGQYVFKVQMQATFNKDVVIRKTKKIDGSIGAEYIVKGSIGGGYEHSEESHATPVFMLAEFNGTLYTRQNIVKVGGIVKGGR